MLNKWDTFFLMIMTLPIMGHVMILPLMLDVAGRDGWLSISLALPVGILFSLVILRLRRRFPRQDFPNMIAQLLGRWLNIPLLWFLSLYFLCLSGFSLAGLVDMTRIAFMPETPTWALAAWFMLMCAYGAYRGVKAIALTAGVLSLIGVLTGHSVTLMDTPNKEFANILPILEFGWSPLLWGSLILSSIWTELLFLMVVPLKDPAEKRLALFWTIGILFNGLMMFSTMTGAIMTFGVGQSDNFIYPALETVRILSLGFIDRFDIYGMILMSFGTYVRTSLYLRLGYNLVVPERMKHKKFKKALFGLFSLGVLIWSVWAASEHARLERITSLYTYGVVLLLIPGLLLALSWFKVKASPLSEQKSSSSG